uniref:EGF-like domain-containing protein n=1 Tax=Timema bartmani TaxID=61472 RepID=A0A7R9F6E0_9NEOP|nr:unnamed protein product [Timema bartmani]
MLSFLPQHLGRILLPLSSTSHAGHGLEDLPRYILDSTSECQLSVRCRVLSHLVFVVISEMSTEPPTTLAPMTCPPGFNIPDTGERCADVNECARDNGGCAQYCSNSRGSFRCSCRLGYALDVDGSSCIGKMAAAHLACSTMVQLV